MNFQRLQRAWKRRICLPLLRRFHPEIEIALGDRRVCIDLRDEIIGQILYLDGEYEPFVERLITSMELEGRVCVDIGAHIGLYTLAMSRQAGPLGQVFAFEPEPHNFRLLRRNLHLNRATNVVAHQVALGSRQGAARLMRHPSNYGDHRISLDNPPSPPLRKGRTGGVSVSMTTLDSILQEIPDSVVDLIKIDVQGYECPVLRGMSETLARNPDAILILEVFPDALREAGASGSELMEQLAELGFSGWELSAHRIVPMAPPWAYDLIRDGKYVDVVLCRDPDRLARLVGRWFRADFQTSMANTTERGEYSTSTYLQAT